MFFVQRTYGPWWDIAPSGKAPINKKAKRNVVSEDFVGKVNVFMR